MTFSNYGASVLPALSPVALLINKKGRDISSLPLDYLIETLIELELTQWCLVRPGLLRELLQGELLVRGMGSSLHS